MSVNVYLLNAVKQDDQGVLFVMKKKGELTEKVTLCRVDKLKKEGDRLFFSLPYLQAEIPEVLVRGFFVSEVSIRERIPGSPHREWGRYHLGSARATVDDDTRSGSPRLVVFVKAENMADARALLHQIRGGQIRPTESYEGEQSGLSTQDLQRLLKQKTTECQQIREAQALTEAVRRDVESDLQAAKKREAELEDKDQDHQRMLREIQRFSERLQKKSWAGLCRTSRIVVELTSIINPQRTNGKKKKSAEAERDIPSMGVPVDDEADRTTEQPAKNWPKS
ncbi:MAG: hypothetical protein ABH826_01235 [Patescibacteria group bacterium]